MLKSLDLAFLTIIHQSAVTEASAKDIKFDSTKRKQMKLFYIALGNQCKKYTYQKCTMTLNLTTFFFHFEIFAKLYRKIKTFSTKKIKTE
jgi:hypothetical protein